MKTEVELLVDAFERNDAAYIKSLIARLSPDENKKMTLAAKDEMKKRIAAKQAAVLRELGYSN